MFVINRYSIVRNRTMQFYITTPDLNDKYDNQTSPQS